ncbi:MAG: rhodanese-like domain-containing protein [Gammaproteobacteria bacterium]|nr:rhodanese-like domain-containing protein [Gammaproteobacteria bacterium]
MRHFTPKQLQEYLESAPEAYLLLDVREPWEYEICHIENSMLLPMGQIPNRLDDLDKNQDIVVICHHGVRSRQVCLYMAHYGFENTINLDGGIEAWAQEVEPTMQRY